MQNTPRPDRQQGIVFIVLLVLLVTGTAFGIFYVVQRVQHKKSASTTAAEVVSAGGSALTRQAENLQRKNDASILLGAVSEYQSENNGKLPDAVASSMLTGMGHYTAAIFTDGAQGAVQNDQLRLVVKAECTSEKATVASSTSRQYVVQYALENADRSYTPQCIAG